MTDAPPITVTRYAYVMEALYEPAGWGVERHGTHDDPGSAADAAGRLLESYLGGVGEGQLVDGQPDAKGLRFTVWAGPCTDPEQVALRYHPPASIGHPASNAAHDEPDPDEHPPIIRGKWNYEGAADLEQAAAWLEHEAWALRALAAQGWRLSGPVTDDYGYLERRS